jgi:hypothetical protein
LSVNHPHSRPNQTHPFELRKFLEEPTAAAMLRAKVRLDTSKECPDTGGYNVDGTRRFIDWRFVEAVHGGYHAPDGRIIQVRVSGMSPAQILQAIYVHEHIEKIILDADNPIDTYQEAHEFATTAEHEYVRSLGVTPHAYEAGIAEMLKYVEGAPFDRVSPGLECSPYIDDPDAADQAIIKRLKELNIQDAFKTPKKEVQYGPSTGDDRCGVCIHFSSFGRGDNLGLCETVNGAIRDSWWCVRFEAGNEKDQEDGNNVQGQGGDTAQAPVAEAPEEGGTDANEGSQGPDDIDQQPQQGDVQASGQGQVEQPSKPPRKKPTAPGQSQDVAALTQLVGKLAEAITELTKSKSGEGQD